MKKLLLAAMVLCSINLTAQTIDKDVLQKEADKIMNKQTQPSVYAIGFITLEEYNYLTKGLKDDLNTGRTTKQGYRFVYPSNPEVLLTGVFETTNYRLVKCYRVNENKPFAFVLKVSANNKTEQTLCVPLSFNDSNIDNNCKKNFLSYMGNTAAAKMLYALLQSLIDF